MADWRDIGIDNYKPAVLLLENKKYSSSVSRFYDAAFSIMTHELVQRGATVDFSQGRETPGHGQLPRLIETWFVQFSEERRNNLSRVADLYRSRLESDYGRERLDRAAATESYGWRDQSSNMLM